MEGQIAFNWSMDDSVVEAKEIVDSPATKESTEYTWDQSYSRILINGICVYESEIAISPLRFYHMAEVHLEKEEQIEFRKKVSGTKQYAVVKLKNGTEVSLQ